MSGRKFSFEVNKTTSAPPEIVFRLVADGANWKDWAKPIVVQSSWARQGDPAPGGVGAIRKVGMFPVFVQEETVEYEQDRRHAYKLVGPRQPVNDYRAEVVLTPTASGGTDIRWSGSFTEKARGTGPAAKAAMGGAVKFFAGKLVQAAEREAAKA
ncbi:MULTISPECIES: SRPBCC family protein [Mycobacterium]|uniref:MxaD family protein n=1 Tax=Mycobacterium kiyosense TaxID=2871094 RepID=A0A9P3Q398_9MYCO|nr:MULTISPECIES: SRPBCC family protein [Mycobacterium]BDB42463.1 MxaD family protein [Mycobacterium kiyosense]BDE14274.1 MxaD family protein [Mycobacterium sp. 20KCMC460]GLB81510.1 MxaD family protein [Mycobacterium kiyosense]GLB90107.1 MxaD family protein [Mycobacterium kiyosense]GLB93703.1 MxaD family protein [Mycobacterium kiyosense]